MDTAINDINKYNEVAELLKVIAHPIRLCIINGLLEVGECNVSFIQNCLNAPQSTISQHLQKLRSAGVVESKRDGTEMYYSVSNKKIANLVKDLIN